jgi:D-erythronate 2-dehydrogenase
VAGLRADVIFHLAAIVSGAAEADFDLGWRVNGRAFWDFLEAVRAEHEASGGSYVPRVVFTSSIAVFGAPYPERIGDDFLTAPQTSYGAQKAMAELLLSDMSRKGYMDGIAIRLPTICVRPGKPNLAASSFFSGIIREPLNGVEAILPVPADVRHWHASPRAAASFLTHAATLDTARLEGRRALNLPGVSCTVEEQIEALREVAGNDTVALIRPRPDETIMRIVQGWPRDFAPERALALGFRAESDFREIIETYIAEDLPAKAS